MRMASLRPPDSIPSPVQDSERLNQALQGLSSTFIYLFSFSMHIDQHNVMIVWSSNPLGYFFLGSVDMGRERSGWKSDSMDIGTQECNPKEADQRHLSTAL